MRRTPPIEKSVKAITPAALSYAGAATYLGLAEKTLRNKVCNGSFPVKPRRFGGKPLFLISELNAFLESLPTDN
jgi:hypothetical protein